MLNVFVVNKSLFSVQHAGLHGVLSHIDVDGVVCYLHLLHIIVKLYS